MFFSQMVLKLISEAITLRTVVQMTSLVNGSDLEIGSVKGNICFLNASDIHIGSDDYFHTSHTCQTVESC